MKKNFFATRVIAAIFVLMALMPAVQAFAWGWARSLPSGHVVITLRGARYHYWGGHFYRHGPIGFYMVMPPIGAI